MFSVHNVFYLQKSLSEYFAYDLGNATRNHLKHRSDLLPESCENHNKADYFSKHDVFLKIQLLNYLRTQFD